MNLNSVYNKNKQNGMKGKEKEVERDIDESR